MKEESKINDEDSHQGAEVNGFIDKSHLQRIKEVIASITAKQAQTIPAITPALSSLLLRLINGGLLSQSRARRTFLGNVLSPRIISEGFITLLAAPCTVTSYIAFIVRFVIVVWNQLIIFYHFFSFLNKKSRRLIN